MLISKNPKGGFTYQPSCCDEGATLGNAVPKPLNPESGCIIPAPPDRRQTISANSRNPSRTLSGFADNMRKIFLFEISNLKFAIPFMILPFSSSPFPLFPPVKSVKSVFISVHPWLRSLVTAPLRCTTISQDPRSPRKLFGFEIFQLRISYDSVSL